MKNEQHTEHKKMIDFLVVNEVVDVASEGVEVAVVVDKNVNVIKVNFDKY
jgi:hypothetical protein